MQLTENFGFLGNHDPDLVKIGALAERYFRDDPPTALIKLRQFAELLSKLIAARNALYVGERETFEDTLRRLSYERILPREAADLFHALRKFGNAAVHETRGTHAEALSGLRFARQLGIWFHRTYGKKPDFNPGPFVPPPPPGSRRSTPRAGRESATVRRGSWSAAPTSAGSMR
jgi:type I restriction enzyme, R subunit